ncbi:MAG TPA: hypothetical protein VIU62_20270 [Chloroflexota bacterium]|jgi:hypothetical protein
MANRTGHGGRRAGAGRKATDAEGPLYSVTFTLRLTDLGDLNRLGDGNYSRGLRRLIDLGNAAGLIPPVPQRDSE